MQSYPHHYSVDVSSEAPGTAVVSTAGVPPLPTAPPAQFGGPGDRWSPETLLIAAAADCFALTFHAVAQASNLAWTALRCTAQGRLERVDGTTRFTQLTLNAHLTVPPATDTARAQRLLEKAEKACLITNSLALTPSLTCTVEAVGGEAPAAKTDA
jgi:organic hydroperoxide reductase OsmC/OhrA